jgi:bifunctional UDP-N-acetylglucosamine pyrophosphorylase/glucosamine-1-phosphate N-acetyltransferase
LTDLVEIILGMGRHVDALITTDFEETLGVNDRIQLADASKNLQQRINEQHMRNGVTIVSPELVYIESAVHIAQDVIIEPNVYLKGMTTIETGTFIGTGSHLENAYIGTGAHIQASYISDSEIGDHTTVGPYAHIRAEAIVEKNARIGNFKKNKKSKLGTGVKAAHLSYMGDALIGDRVNMSCGAITANYDGKKKHQTVIGNDAMIGSNVNLIAPVVIGEGAYVAAGSTVTRNVPDEALAIARTKQENKADYAKRL